jgi:hypothetical protein
MNIEITSNQIWNAIEDQVHNAITDKVDDLEIMDDDSIADVVNREFEYGLHDNNYIIEDIAERVLGDFSGELEDGMNASIQALETRIGQLQSQLRLANFKLRRSK